jgi:hypothetical protein
MYPYHILFTSINIYDINFQKNITSYNIYY